MKWINVEEELPEEELCVFVLVDDEEISIAYLSEGEWFFQIWPWESEKKLDHSTVTRWAELSTPVWE